MPRPTVRFVAFVVLALLGAPVAMHVVMHDLHGHHHHEAAAAEGAQADAPDHEHPIVASPAPEVPGLTRAALSLAILPTATPAAWTGVATAKRNAVSHGALRMDDDVGLQPLLSTFLI